MKKLNMAGRTWVRLAVKAVVVLLILWVCFGIFVGMRRISDISMNGRINDGDFVLFNRISSDYLVGDVVIYDYDGQEYLSEIIGIDGDLITTNEEGYILVNGEVVSSSPVFDFALGDTDPFGSGYRVPAGTYFVLNSNYECADDSRVFGAIYKKNIKGNIIALLLRTRSF